MSLEGSTPSPSACPRGAARSARHPVTVEIMGSNPIGDAMAKWWNRQTRDAQTVVPSGMGVRLSPWSLRYSLSPREGLGEGQLAGVPRSGGALGGARLKPELQRWFRIFKNPDGETDDHASVRTRRSGFESWSGYCFGVLGRLFSNGRSRFEAWPKRCVRGVAGWHTTL